MGAIALAFDRRSTAEERRAQKPQRQPQRSHEGIAYMMNQHDERASAKLSNHDLLGGGVKRVPPKYSVQTRSDTSVGAYRDPFRAQNADAASKPHSAQSLHVSSSLAFSAV
ncbi:hypothetical protein V494_08215 [Pseudogymnoascus sp. VKM F-4513 (FW-928)]|nr:hypothetical protein V494_08215 [Pseudogymnoascus sp. VKM F-4513 (FW-928)]